MTCQDIEHYMMDYLTGELSVNLQLLFREHIEQCDACAANVQEMQRVWSTLDEVAEQPVPESLQTRILEIGREALSPASLSGFWEGLKHQLAPLRPLLMGLLTTMVLAGSLSLRIDFDLIPPLGLTVAGALWTGLFAVVFYLFSLGSRQHEPSWKFLAQASLVAVGIFLIITFISPLPHSVRFCSQNQLTQPLMERLSVGGAYFLFGALYALLPMGIAAYLSASRRGKNPFLRGSLAGVMFMMLLIPGIFLQCAPFALGVVLGWFGGALVGSLAGGVIGYWIRYRLAGR